MIQFFLNLMRFRTLIFLPVVLSYSAVCYSQNILSGKITDSKNR
jgi:hypothetical protein